MHNKLLDLLYERHYSIGAKTSKVTSSHWKSVGQHNVVKTASGWSLEGKGFGSRRENNLITRMLRLPSSHLVRDLIQRHECPGRFVEIGLQIAHLQRRHFDYDCARHVLTLALFDKYLVNSPIFESPDGKKSIGIIGDTYGYFGAMLSKWLPNTRIVEINLGKTLIFDAYYLGLAFPDSQHHLLYGNADTGQSDFVYVEAEDITVLESQDIWLYVNIASMQEMDPHVIHSYFNTMRRSKASDIFLYCCNREQKTLPDGTITKYLDYGWSPRDIMMLDELCPWLQTYPTNFPPRWKRFEGPFRHRFLKLSPIDKGGLQSLG